MSQNLRWTERQLTNYMARQMRDQPRARAKMQEQSSELKAVISPHRKATAHGVGKGSLDANNQNNGYNLKIVLAWFKECGLPSPLVEYRFDSDRKWRFDFAWNEWEPQCGRWKQVALECQGGLFSGGAHVRGPALLREHEKLNQAAILGWRVMFTTPDQLCTKETADMVRKALGL